MASGDCPETSALCGKPDTASKENDRIQCWKFITENWWHLGKVGVKSAGKQHLRPAGR